MMNRDCGRFVETILSSDGGYTEEIRRHMAECPDCRALASEWGSVRQALLLERELPHGLDERIRFAASRRDSVSSFRRIVYKAVYVTAAAACVMLVGALFMFGDKRAGYVEPTGHEPHYDWRWSGERRMAELDIELDLGMERLSSGGVEEIDWESVLFPAVEVPDIPQAVMPDRWT